MTDRAEQLRHALISRLKVRHLSFLRSVHRQRTLSRVAVEMGLSQSAITKTLKEIEDIFMTPLFERTSRGLNPTAAGETALHHALISLADIDATSKALAAINSGLTGRVRIGITPQMPAALLSAAFAHLLDQSPRVAVTVKEGTTDELVAALSARELDCVIGRSFYGDIDIDITQEALYQEVPCLVVAAGSRTRLSKGSLDWRSLAALDWIMPPTNTPTRRTLNAIFLGAGVPAPTPIVETISIKTIETLLRREPNAITILARDLGGEIAASGAGAILPYELSWNMPPVSLFVSQSIARQPTVRGLTAAIRDAASRLAAGKRA